MGQLRTDGWRQAAPSFPAVLRSAGVVALVLLTVAVGIDAITSATEPNTTMARAGEGHANPRTGPATETPAPQSPPVEEPDVSATDRAPAARQLALTYAHAARRLVHQSRGGSASSDVLLASVLRQTAKSYRAAARSADRGDLAGYAEAMTAAASGRQALATVLEGLSAAYGAAESSSAGHSPRGNGEVPATQCGGDSSSDDPSDDACDS